MTNEDLTTFFAAGAAAAGKAAGLPDDITSLTFGLGAIGTLGASSEPDRFSDSLEANAMAQSIASRRRILKFIFHNNSLMDSGARLTGLRRGSIVL